MGKINIWVLYISVIIVNVESSLHRVGGGRYTWNPFLNFSEWTSEERFYPGDWLYFGFDETRYNILQVNKRNYKKCIHTNFIFNITRTGQDVFQLQQPHPYYFICGIGSFCQQGMKLAVDVLPHPLSSTATTLIPSNAFNAIATAILTFAFMKALCF